MSFDLWFYIAMCVTLWYVYPYYERHNIYRGIDYFSEITSTILSISKDLDDAMCKVKRLRNMIRQIKFEHISKELCDAELF